MGFTLYFASTSNFEAVALSKELNVPKLFTQAYERKYIKEWVEEKRAGKLHAKLFVDSGAYTAHTKGIDVDVDEYIEFTNNLDDQITLIAQVDKIPGTFQMPRTKQEILDAPRISWENYLYMIERVKSVDKIVPIFHQDEDFYWLRNMLEFRHKDGRPIDYIGISGSKDKGSKDRADWYAKCFAIIEQSSNPNVKTHCFGNSTIKQLEMFPFTSSDATSWIKIAAFGGIMTPWGGVKVSGIREHDKDHVFHLPGGYEKISKFVESYGFKLEDMIHNREEEGHVASRKRINFNLTYLQDWADNYEYKGPKSFIKKGLF